MKTHYYYRILRKTLIQFLDTLNDIKVARYATNTTDEDTIIKYVKVPLRLGAKEKVWYWLNNSKNERKDDEMLPMMSANIAGINIATERMVNKSHKLTTSRTPSAGTLSQFLNPTPYNIDMALTIWSLHISDLDQILEQILPYFSPHIQIIVKIPELENVQFDMKVVFQGGSPDITNEYPDEERRIVKWNLDFQIQGYMVKPLTSPKLIKEIILKYYTNEDNFNDYMGTESTFTSGASGYEAESQFIQAYSPYYDDDGDKLYNYEIFQTSDTSRVTRVKLLTADTSSIDLTLSLPTDKSMTLYWGDGDQIIINGPINEVEYSHSYDDSGTYHVYMDGDYDEMTYLECSDNSLTSLDVTGLTSLETLHCEFNSLTSLDVSGLTNLTDLRCYENSLTALDVSGLTDLEYLYCSNNFISVLDVSELVNLTDLRCNFNNLSILDVSELVNLEALRVAGNSISVLDVSELVNLTYLHCNENSISVLDISALTVLKQLRCSKNGIIQSMVDTILCYLNSAGLINGYCSIGGTNAYPSATGLSCATNLEDSGWEVSISDEPSVALLTWSAEDTETSKSLVISLPSGKSVILYWGDGESTTITGPKVAEEYTHLYDSTGTYNVTISGDYDSITQFDCNHNIVSTLDVSILTSLKYMNCSDNGFNSEIVGIIICAINANEVTEGELCIWGTNSYPDWDGAVCEEALKNEVRNWSVYSTNPPPA